MAERERGKRVEIRVKDIKDPLPDATFGSIGRYVEVTFPEPGDEPVVPQRITLRFDEKQAAHVDPWTLTLFRVDVESRTFTPVESSRVNVYKREISAWVNESGTYGVIGLHKHKAIVETLRLFDRFAPQLLEERERGEHGFQDRICGLILCNDPLPFGGEPPLPGDLCAKCLGIDIAFEKLPDRYLLERPPWVSRFPGFEDDEDDGDEPLGVASLLAWGGNTWGELGDGSKTIRRTPVWAAPNLAPRKIVGSGLGDWTLALSTDGSVWAWGTNVAGQLGNGILGDSSIPVRVGFLANIVDIAAGTDHALAVGSDGSVWRWGAPDSTNSTAPPDRLPVRITALTDIVAVAAGGRFSLALRNDGRVFAWGSNSGGQLGDGSIVFRATPAQVPNLAAIRSIAAGASSSFAIRSNGSVMAWGSGIVGDGAAGNRLSPVSVPGLSNVEQISAGFHGLARTTAGEVWFWGSGSYGESGDGTGAGLHLTPVRVPGLPVITGIAVGGAHNVAMQNDGTVWAWGSNAFGQIGVAAAGYTQTTPIAVPLPGGRQAASVGAGWQSSFAIVG